MSVGSPASSGAAADVRTRLHAEVGKVIVGQHAVVDGALIALLSGGHVLLDGPPGVAKSLAAAAVARACGLSNRRVQFTPDLLPSDLTGTLVLRGGELAFREGPVFTNVLLADELNRTPPKTQAALLEAMQERQVTIDGVSHPLPAPFLVLATQNPIEFEGTYPLPESQLDRFLLRVEATYPSAEDERSMLDLPRRGIEPTTLDDVGAVLAPGALPASQAEVDAVRVADEVKGYVADVVRATRELPSVALGASPRAAVHLLAASRALAALQGRAFVTPDDVVALAPSVLAHRLVLTAEADLDRFTPAAAVATALRAVAVPR